MLYSTLLRRTRTTPSDLGISIHVQLLLGGCSARVRAYIVWDFLQNSQSTKASKGSGSVFGLLSPFLGLSN